MRGWIALAFITGCAFAQSGVPTIAREGLTQWPDGHAKLLSPGVILSFYGGNLGPESCSQPMPVNGPYPTDPDDAALSVLPTLVDHPDGLVRQFARLAVLLFDENVQKRAIPAKRWDDLHRIAVTIG